jgi:hypothetical protein
MDYTDILKRAWRVTWKYKALWVLGFFVGGASGSSSSSSRTSTGSNSPFGSGSGTAAVQHFLATYGAIIIVAALFAVLIGLIFMVIAVAARGGLIHLVNEAEEGRPVKLGAGWRAGFSKWWRLFGVTFLAGLPLFIIGSIILVIVGASAFSTIAAYAARGGGTPDTATLRALIAPLLGAGCFLIILSLIAVFLGVVLSVASSLGLRYVMLEDRGTIDSLKQGWHDVWSRRGAFLMFLLLLVIGIGVSLVFGFVAAIFTLPAIAASGSSATAVGGAMAGIAGLVLLVPAAIFGTFVDASWTIFFRRMTGLQAAPAVLTAPAYPAPASAMPPAPPAYAPPQGYMPPAPPAPPVAAPPEPVIAPEQAPAPDDVPPPPLADV